MKRRISDLLEGIREDTVELNTQTPLSSNRIKELTMSKINSEKKTHNTKRIAFRILVAAAAISLLTVTAFAAENVFGAGDWFRDILGNRLEEDRKTVQQEGLDITLPETVSQEQIDVVNELGQVFEETSITSEGTTMTLTAAYADANVIHLYFQAEAPEGTVLPDGILYQFYDYNAENWNILELPQGAPYELSGYNVEVEALPDSDPTDNRKDFHVTIYTQSGMEMQFNDGVSKLYHITGIYEQVVDMNGDEDGYVPLAPGSFTFDIGIANEAKVVELDVDGLTYGGHRTRTWTHDSPCKEFCKENLTGQTDPDTGLPIHAESWDYTVTPKRLAISPLSADWACDYTCSDDRASFGLSFRVVMKDGSSPLLVDGGGTYNDEKCMSSGTNYFSTPIDLSQVDYILIGDPEINSTHKVYLP
ncbi:MAG: DUF4179 domain-containing protein [Candidatus Faecousia sp.]|nr:DUF4179 domain-containing protein [Candidatus Faecousia sp.]